MKTTFQGSAYDPRAPHLAYAEFNPEGKERTSRVRVEVAHIAADNNSTMIGFDNRTTTPPAGPDFDGDIDLGGATKPPPAQVPAGRAKGPDLPPRPDGRYGGEAFGGLNQCPVSTPRSPGGGPGAQLLAACFGTRLGRTATHLTKTADMLKQLSDPTFLEKQPKHNELAWVGKFADALTSAQRRLEGALDPERFDQASPADVRKLRSSYGQLALALMSDEVANLFGRLTGGYVESVPLNEELLKLAKAHGRSFNDACDRAPVLHDRFGSRRLWPEAPTRELHVIKETVDDCIRFNTSRRGIMASGRKLLQRD